MHGKSRNNDLPDPTHRTEFGKAREDPSFRLKTARSMISREARNARTHSDQQVAQIAASIREFGFTNPVLIDEEDGIIAGHGRVLAAYLLGLDEVPCIVLAHLTPVR
jgi:ParB-like chromosome segregation protein Spo0J